MRYRAIIVILSLLAICQVPVWAELISWDVPVRRVTAPSLEDRWYEQDYDDTWDSIRTYRLMTPLKTPLRIYVDTQHPLYREEFLAYVKESLEAWAEPLEGRLTYTIVDNPDEADIKVYWTRRFSDPEQAGETAIEIGKSVVTIKPVGYPPNITRANIMHEMGHALGITGHSDHPEDIMCSGRDWTSVEEYKSYQPRLSQQDKYAIQRLYSLSWVPGEDLYQVSPSVASAYSVIPEETVLLSLPTP